MLRQCTLLLLLALASSLPLLVSSWAPSSLLHSRVSSTTPSNARLSHTHSVSSRTANSFLTSCQAQMNQQLDEPDFLLEAPTLPEMKEEWLEQIQKMDTSELIEKAMNACLLIAAFGFAFYNVVSVDHEFTRGWTQQEIAMRIPLDNWASYESALAEKPIITKTFINVVIYSLGDWLSQTVFQKKNILEFDVKRTLRNGFIGLCFGPLVHMYYEWSDQILPVEGGIMNRVEKVFMDQTLYLTIKCSIYIAAVGLLQGDDIKTVKETIEQRIGPICLTAWKFWPLVHCVTYGVIPNRHRMLWVNCVDLIWNAILASMSRKEEPEDEQVLVLPALETTSTGVSVDFLAAAVAVEQLQSEEAIDVAVVEDGESAENVTEAVLL